MTVTLVSRNDFVWVYDKDPTGTISIGGVSMHGPAWNVPSLFDLMGTPDQRGRDRLVPGSVGVHPNMRRRTVTRHSLRFLVNGYWDRLGNENADEWEGLEANVAYLNANVLLPTEVGDGTRQLVWTRPSGATVTTDVHVLPMASPVGLAGAAAFRAVLELSVPAGDLHL